MGAQIHLADLALCLSPPRAIAEDGELHVQCTKIKHGESWGAALKGHTVRLYCRHLVSGAQALVAEYFGTAGG